MKGLRIPYRVMALVLVVFCCMTGKVRAQYEHLLFKTHAQRAPYMSKVGGGKIMNYKLDSAEAFSELGPIQAMAVKHGDRELLLECKLVASMYYFARDDRAIIPFLEGLRPEIKEQNSVWADGRLEDILGQFYFNMHEYEKAFEHFLRMYEITKDLDPIVYPGRESAYCIFANSLYQFREYRQAIFYLKEGLRDTLKEPLGGYYINAINTIGLCYRQLHNLDSSSFHFRDALQKANALNNKTWIGICSGNLGENYFMQGQYATAKPLLQKDADIALESRDFGLASNALMILAEINMREGNLTAAGELLAKARESAYRSQQYSRLKKLYPLLSRFYMATGQPKLAATFLDSSLVVRDSLESAFNSLYMARAQQKMELQKHRADVDELNNRGKIRTIQRNSLIVIILMASVLAFFPLRQAKA